MFSFYSPNFHIFLWSISPISFPPFCFPFSVRKYLFSFPPLLCRASCGRSAKTPQGWDPVCPLPSSCTPHIMMPALPLPMEIIIVPTLQQSDAAFSTQPPILKVLRKGKEHRLFPPRAQHTNNFPLPAFLRLCTVKIIRGWEGGGLSVDGIPQRGEPL